MDIPETGFRSVSPRARTPIMLSRRARTRAKMVRVMEIMPRKEYWTAKTQKARERARPKRVVFTPIRCSGGASYSSSSSSSAGEGFAGPLDPWAGESERLT